MTEQVMNVTDLGPGDGGKGGVVHKLVWWLKPHTIIKEGGANGNHGVCTSAGERFGYSQWGCGTFEGVPTYLSPRFVVHPEGIINEAQALRYGTTVHDPFALLTIDGRCLCATPYHGISSRLKELARGKQPRGTVGTGVGEAVRYHERLPTLSIFAADLGRSDIRNQLAAVREQIANDLAPVIASNFLREDRDAVDRELKLLASDGFLDYNAHLFNQVAQLATIVDADYLGRVILARRGSAVVERSHGVLTDRYAGFHPHTSALRTLPRFTEEMLRSAGYGGKIVNVGVHRAYTIRHGAGPMPTANPDMSEKLLPGSHKQNNRYQGEVRVGPLDLPLLRYALAACGGPQAFHALAITWFDQVVRNGEWTLCHRYRDGTSDPTFFTPQGELKVRHSEDAEQFRFTEALGQQLHRCVPELTTCRIPQDASKDQLLKLTAAVLNERLGVPVRMLALGPTENDKVIT